jgi:hypothetical protein
MSLLGSEHGDTSGFAKTMIQLEEAFLQYCTRVLYEEVNLDPLWKWSSTICHRVFKTSYGRCQQDSFCKILKSHHVGAWLRNGSSNRSPETLLSSTVLPYRRGAPSNPDNKSLLLNPTTGSFEPIRTNLSTGNPTVISRGANVIR